MEQHPELLPPAAAAKQLTQLLLAMFAPGIWSRLDRFAVMRRAQQDDTDAAKQSQLGEYEALEEQKTEEQKADEARAEEELAIGLVRQMVSVEQTTEVDPVLAALMEAPEQVHEVQEDEEFVVPPYAPDEPGALQLGEGDEGVIPVYSEEKEGENNEPSPFA